MIHIVSRTGLFLAIVCTMFSCNQQYPGDPSSDAGLAAFNKDSLAADIKTLASDDFQGRHILCRVSSKGYHTLKEHKSIVILTGRRTISAGEIVALAFKGKAQTFLIGEPTAGLTTANATYSLSDKSLLVLSVCQEADCNGQICQGSIQPDKFIGTDAVATGNDPAKQAAISWLMRQ